MYYYYHIPGTLHQAGSTRFARLPVDVVKWAFFIDTNRSFLCSWIKNSCLHFPIFQGVLHLSDLKIIEKKN
jgi:hypothetical protein